MAVPAGKASHQTEHRIDRSGKGNGLNPPDQGHGRSRPAGEDVMNLGVDGATTGADTEVGVATIAPSEPTLIALPEHRGDVADRLLQEIPHLEGIRVNEATAEGPEAETNPTPIHTRIPHKDCTQEIMPIAGDRKQMETGITAEEAQKTGPSRKVLALLPPPTR